MSISVSLLTSVLMFLCGRAYQAMRYPLGDSVLALQCDEQRKRAQRAEALLKSLVLALRNGGYDVGKAGLD